ncbi:MAG: chromo domain-containing protein, partial [Dehalococcoidales bacterium]|nr:chromo domain-containing protein [Dehalococcoidales bacterium]
MTVEFALVGDDSKRAIRIRDARIEETTNEGSIERCRTRLISNFHRALLADRECSCRIYPASSCCALLSHSLHSSAMSRAARSAARGEKSDEQHAEEERRRAEKQAMLDAQDSSDDGEDGEGDEDEGSAAAASATRRSARAATGSGSSLHAVESILAQRTVRGGKIQFQIRWEGYTETSWEDEKNLTSCADLLKQFRKKRQEKEEKAAAAAASKEAAASSTATATPAKGKRGAAAVAAAR